MSRNKIDRSGQIINGLMLNKRIEDYLAPGGSKGLARYNCTCELCGNEYNGLFDEIRRKVYPGCGCLYKEGLSLPRPNRRHDITNERFGRCIAKERQSDGRWLCICDCGNWFITSLSHLTTGHTKSCGCYRVDNSRSMKMLDLTGQIFGRLTALKYLYSKTFPSGGSAAIWLCKCECGALTEVSAQGLTSGDTKSCGCLAASKRELLIRQYFKENNVNYKAEYTFDDLVLKQHLKYDFAIIDKDKNLLCLIEHYGVQHYVDNSGIDFGKQQREVTDKIKQNYCKSRNIKLYIIKYNENINDKLNNILAELHVNTVPSSQEIA